MATHVLPRHKAGLPALGAGCLLAAGVVLAGCATSTKYPLDLAATSAPSNVKIEDRRPPGQKQAEIKSLSITSCWYGVYQIGEDQTEPARVPYLVSALGPEFSGRTLRIDTFEVFNNWQSALRPAARAVDPTGAAYGLAQPTSYGGAAANAIGVAVAAAIIGNACAVDSPQLAVEQNPANLPAVIVNYDVTVDSRRAKGTVVQLEPQGKDANVGGAFVSERVKRAMAAAVLGIAKGLQPTP